jgi:hypothetical protein
MRESIIPAVGIRPNVRNGSKAVVVRRWPPIARPSHRTCVVSQRLCVGRPLPSQIMCVGNRPLLRVGPFIIARRYNYRRNNDALISVPGGLGTTAANAAVCGLTQCYEPNQNNLPRSAPAPLPANDDNPIFRDLGEASIAAARSRSGHRRHNAYPDPRGAVPATNDNGYPDPRH